MMECNCLVDMGKHALQLTMAAVVLLGSQALALADDCKSIEDATKRLACYDRTETPPKVTDQQPLNTSLTPAMRELRSRLDKSFLCCWREYGCHGALEKR
jgi:hypothetical protein